MRKGIILAGGKGTRLAPVTNVTSKQLIPVYDKPMIYYPLSTLMLSGIREILIITKPNEKFLFELLLGNGSRWGIDIKYEVQQRPNGLAEAFLIGSKFIKESSTALILGDNLFHGSDLTKQLSHSNNQTKGAHIYAYQVQEPGKYGIIDFDEKGNAISIEEKPKDPKTNYAVTGLYFYDNSVIEKAKKVKLSRRGELEITSINNMYLKEKNLHVNLMSRGIAWLDTGTFDSLNEAGTYIRTLENRQGLKVGCPEEVAWRKGWINDEELEELAIPIRKSGYGEYLIGLLEDTSERKLRN